MVALLTGFARALRSAGLVTGTGDLLSYSQSLARLDPSDLLDLYWAGRATLVRRRDDIATYDQVFRTYFLGAAGPARELITIRASAEPKAEASALVVPAAEPESRRETEPEQAALGLMASGHEALRRKSFADCSPAELAALRRIMKRIRLDPPARRTRRTRPARTGRSPDWRRMIRGSLRRHGEPPPLAWRDRRVKLRPLILILDISGSMADYSRNLLQFAHCAERSATRVEVFCFGTRLTRITASLRTRSADKALEQAALTVFDWEGGTRIGECLTTFVRDWGRRGLCRGGLVVICSDGLDRGDPETLATAMERLARLSHAVVWVNPHCGRENDVRGSAVGMLAAMPHIDLLLPARDLAGLEELAARLPALG